MLPGRTTVHATPSGPVSVSAAAVRGRAPTAREAAREADHAAFLAGHWPELAAAAFEGYRRHGAGAVVLWRAHAASRWSRRRPFEPERLWYTTHVHALPGTPAVAFDGWEAHLVEVYDPQAEAFVEGAAVAGYRLSGAPAPPEAHRRSRAALN